MTAHLKITEDIQKRVFNHFKEHLAEGFVYHNYQHTLDTVDACKEIGKSYELGADDMQVLLLAAWLHDTGYSKQYEGHEEESAAIAEQWLAEYNYPAGKINQVRALIRSTKYQPTPENLLEEILHDADLIHLGQKDFADKAALLRMEWEKVLNQKFTSPEWQQKQVDFLMEKQFLTEFAASKYGSRLEKNLRKKRKALKKSIRKKQKNKIDKLKSRKLGRGVETMYRTIYRNHINLSSIADAKANMMISLNTIIMSVIITVVGSGFAFGGGLFQSVRFTAPITILLIGSLIAVIFAVISARPEVTKKEVNLQKIKNNQSSVLFFGNFSKLKLRNFLSNMQELKADRDLLYDNMSIDIYYLGQVLTRKYRLLRYSYTIFISGLTLAVISFLLVLIYTNR